MARKSLKVEGMSASDVKSCLNGSIMAVSEARFALLNIKAALPARDYQSIATHLDKAADTLTKRLEAVAKAADAEATREEKKKMDEKIRAALADPEKAEALKELLNL